MTSLRSRDPVAETVARAPAASSLSGARGHLQARELRLAYAPGASPVIDLEALEVQAGATLGISGPSGSGKTSLLYLLTGIQPPQAGRIVWGTADIARLREGARDRWRRQNVGFVFQDFHLIPGMSAIDNVLLPATFDRLRVPPPVRARAHALLDRVGAPRGARAVDTLSRGEQQRVALARALLREPRIIVADEPTASLDAVSGAQVIDLLLATARDAGATLLVVTHDARFLERLETVCWLERGRLSRR